MAARGIALVFAALLASTLFTGMQGFASAETDSLFCDRPLSSYARVIDGTLGDDILEGTPGDDLIRGFAGNDTIYGKAGNDCLKGGEGGDSIWGGDDDDSMYGHEGGDRLVGDDGNDAAFGGEGDDEMWGNASDDKLVGEHGDDIIHGDGGSDKLYGNDGEDLLWGGAGDDIAAGGAGNDKAIGDDGDDRMWGGEGDDKLLGLAGDDGLVGDAGSDQLYDDLGDDGLNGGDGIDGCYDIVGANIAFNCEEPGSKDQQGDSAFRDFDIKNYGIDENGEAFIEVYGKAGQTLPSGAHTAYAYVIHTDNGIYASDSHEAQHADDEDVANKSWHGHMIVFDPQGCVEEIGAFKSKAHLDGDRVVITDTQATQVIKVQTVRLELQVDDPDNPPPGTTCIAKVVEVFDEAAG